jgi:hypothetical protein
VVVWADGVQLYRKAADAGDDRICGLHLWRLPGHPLSMIDGCPSGVRRPSVALFQPCRQPLAEIVSCACTESATALVSKQWSTERNNRACPTDKDGLFHLTIRMDINPDVNLVGGLTDHGGCGLNVIKDTIY